jgi:hypothetical protein
MTFGLGLGLPSIAQAAPIWNVESQAMPTDFQSNDGPGNDAYYIALENIGDTTSSGQITLVDHLPPGITTSAAAETPVAGQNVRQWACPGSAAGQSVVECTVTYPGPPDGVEPMVFALNDAAAYDGPVQVALLHIPVQIAGDVSGQLENTVTVEGGGALSATVTAQNSVNLGSSAFGAAYLHFRAVGPDGEPFTQASGHPWALSTDFQFNQELKSGARDAYQTEGSYLNAVRTEEARTVVAELPLGLVGDPQAAPRCSQRAFTEPAPGLGAGSNLSACAADTRVGVASLAQPGFISGYQLYNLVPEAGHAAEFGFHYENVPVVLFGDVVKGTRGYLLRVVAVAPQAGIHAVSLTFYGDPAATFQTGGKESAFLTSPSDCDASEEERLLQLHIDTWTDPGIGDPVNGDFSDSAWVRSTAMLAPAEGCGSLTFQPWLAFAPSAAAEGSTSQADEPSGYNANLEVPQTQAYSELATPELKTATVALAAGTSVSPSAANGLQACSNVQIALDSSEPGACPLASQIGTAKVMTPLLEEALEGEVFVGEPECAPCTESDASEGHIFRLFIQVHSEKLGITIKLSGAVQANPSTGQLTATFKENPQLPFSDLELRFKNGPRAPLANPQTCGTFTTVSHLEPWSAPETPTAVSQSPFAITGCDASLPFAPVFSAGTASPAAGAYSPLSVTLARNDGEQDLGAITVTTPPGLLGKIAGIPRCGEAQANAGTCPAASQIGTTTVTAGPGSDPYTITGGKVYLTTGYKNQPFGLAIVVPAVAGPFNLGNVVVRASIAVNPATAALTVASNPLPQLVDGVPIRLRTVTVEVNRPALILNATDCAQRSISATVTGEHPIGSGEAAKTSTVSSAYAASGCADLPFKPKLTAAAGGHGSKAGGTSLTVKLESPGVGQSGLAKVDLQLPKALAARDTTLRKACLAHTFEANPAACPEGSVIGKATIHTPLLDDALTGPAYLVSHGGEAFPDVEFVLQGEGMELVLDGKTNIKKGITYSNFDSTPDAPFTSFETQLPTGPHSIFTTNVPAKDHYSLCDTSLAMPIKLIGQNGAVIEQRTKVSVTGCKMAKPLTRAQKLTKALKGCKKDRKKKRRSLCQAEVRSKYGPKHKTKKRKKQ